MPTAISAAAAIAAWRAGLGFGGRPESASMTGRRATVRAGHQAAAVAARTARTTVSAISAQGRLSRSIRWPTADSSVGATATQSARPTIVPQTAAIAPTMAPLAISTRRRCFCVAPIGGEHAELAQPSLRDDGEARGGDQRGQEEEDGGHGEHRQRVRRSVVADPLEPAKPEPSARDPGRIRSTVARVEQNRDVVRRARGRGRDERELVAQLARVLDDADDRPAPPSSARVDPISSRSSSATPSVTATWRGPAG